jgi:hypothetical protein
LAVRHITEFAIFDPLSYYVPEFGGTTMGEKERPSGANHSEQADRIQDSMPPVSLTREPTRNDERVSMSPHAETEVFVPEQHSSQTQPAALEREVSSVDLGALETKYAPLLKRLLPSPKKEMSFGRRTMSSKQRIRS